MTTQEEGPGLDQGLCPGLAGVTHHAHTRGGQDMSCYAGHEEHEEARYEFYVVPDQDGAEEDGGDGRRLLPAQPRTV